MFTGSGVALVTPFTKDNKVNFDKIAELIEFHAENKTDALVVTGTTGESPTLNDEEKIEIFRFSVEKTAGRMQVIAGTGSNDNRHAVHLSREAEKVGVDALLLVTPYYNKGNTAGLIKHFESIADSVNIPCILYNVPSRTSLNLSPDIVEQLSKHKNIAAIKEASGNIAYVAEICRRCPNDFYVYSGNDDMVVPLLSLGGKGVISVIANIMPRETHDMCEFYFKGEVEKSRDLQLKLKPFVDSLFYETSPIPIKKAMNLAGFDVGGLRLPLSEMSEEGTQILIREMKKLNLLKE